MNNKLVDLLVIKQDNHEKYSQKNIQYSKYILNNENKLDFTILLILRLLFHSTKSNLIT